MDYDKVREVGYNLWYIILKKINTLRGIKHNLNEHEAESYYENIYSSFIKEYSEGIYDKADKLKILDVGCGAGRFAVELADLGHEVTGIDYMQDALDEVEKEARNRGVSIDLKCGSAEDVLKNLPKCEYDTVLCIEMLYNSPKYKELMGYMRELLSPDGVMICTHRPKFYYIVTLLEKNKYDQALRAAKSSEGIITPKDKPLYCNWQTTSEVREIYDELNMRLLGLHSVGMFSGFGIDGMSEVANPEAMDKHERETLFDLETEDLEDYSGIGRYMLAASSRK